MLKGALRLRCFGLLAAAWAVLTLASGSMAAELTEGVYDYRRTPIVGAFGLSFGQTFDDAIIAKRLGWMSTEAPAGWDYRGKVPFRMDTYLVRPMGLPRLLNGLPGRYLVRTDFEGHPIWITATLTLPAARLKEIRSVLQRMYQTEDQHYTDGTHQIVLETTGDVTRLMYFDVPGLTAYMDRRNVTLLEKYKEAAGGWGLSMTENQILSVARSFRSLRPDFEAVYGFSFLTQVAAADAPPPDEFHTFTVPRPLPMPWQNRVRYELMVSPDRLPINLRLNVNGSKPQLAYEKWVIEEALMLVFRGFLKRTENHTVLLMGGNSVSVALRDGELFVSVINGHQNRLALARDDERRAAEALAARIARRREEMKEEQGF